MPSKRAFSGNRKGTGAFINTLEDLRKISKKQRSAGKLDEFFRLRFREDYPEATEDEIKQKKKILIEDHIWGNGQKLGRATDIVAMTKNDAAYKAFKDEEDKRIDKHVTTVVANQAITEEGKALEAEYDKKMDDVAKEYFNELSGKKGRMERAINQKPAVQKRKETRKKILEDIEALEKAKKTTPEGLAKQAAQLDDTKRKEAFKQLMAYVRESKARKKKEREAQEQEREAQEQDDKEYADVQKKATEKKEKKQKALEAKQQEYEKKMDEYDRTPSAMRGAPPKPNPSIVPRKAKEPEIEHKEEQQFKKINRKDIGDIDDGVKTNKRALNTHMNPTVHLTDIHKALAKQKDRLKLRPAKITFHRLGKPIANAADKTF